MFSLRDLCAPCSLDLDVLRAQRIMGYFILITHKSTGYEHHMAGIHFLRQMIRSSVKCTFSLFLTDLRSADVVKSEMLSTLFGISCVLLLIGEGRMKAFALFGPNSLSLSTSLFVFRQIPLISPGLLQLSKGF